MEKLFIWIFLLLDLSAICYGGPTVGCIYEVTSWTPVTSCSVTCGEGIANYTRTCCEKINVQNNCVTPIEIFADMKNCTANSTVVGNGGWSNWTSWSTCPCGSGGTQTRTRTCTNPAPYCNGAYCSGNSTEYQTCPVTCCPVNGNWSAWSAWNTCSVTCGGGSQSRSRSCSNPSPSCNGTTCSGLSTESTTCNSVCCPVNGSWSNWASWQACPVTCGGTTNNQIRTRSCTNPATSCGGIDCTITSGETNTSYTTCNTGCCPVDGAWSIWSAVDTCSVTCGGGIQSMIRNCTNPYPSCNGTDCIGNSTQIINCNSVCCPVDGAWSDWGSWEACPVTCGGTTNNQIRTRSCTNPATSCGGGDCTISSGETNTSYTTCNTECCPVDGAWSEWSALDACSVTCGGGSQSMIRNCTNPFPSCNGTDCDGNSTEIITCNSVCCPVDGAWSDWGSWEECPVKCGGTTNNQIRTRSCTNPPTFCGGIDCTVSSGETNTSYSTCNTECCPVDGAWTDWSALDTCSVTCGGGIQSWIRNCTNPSPSCNGTDCEGNFTETTTCNSMCCPVDGAWSDWGSWEACPVTCEGAPNNQIRTRSCTNPPTFCGGIDCTISSGESNTSYTTCNPECCPVDGAWSSWSALDTCTVTCGGGIQSWIRNCTNPSPSCNGTDCEGNSTKTTTCNSMCCPVDGAWSDWGSWEACPVTCGGTTNNQIRRRSCSNPATSCGGVDCTVSSGESNTSYTTCNTQCCLDTTPLFTNLDRELPISEELVNGTIYKIHYYKEDSRNVTSWGFITSNSNISFDISTEMVYLKAIPNVGTYTMAFNITDSCGLTGSGTLNIDVFNTPPLISSLPSFVQLHEDVKEGKILHTLKVQDRQANDTIKCSLINVIPSSKSFTVDNIHQPPDYGVYLEPNATFDYNTNKKYELLVSCEDGKTSAVTGYFYVYIEKNHPPRFLNLPASVDLDTSTTLIGDLVYKIRMVDDENDTLAFNLTIDPSNGPFIIQEYGAIVTTVNLSSIVTPAYNLKVSVNDGKTTVVARTLAIHLRSINDKPVISNLPLPHPLLIEENSKVGTTLYHVIVRDLDIADTHVIYGDFHPNIGADYFYLSTDGFLKISSELDYESINDTSFKIVVTATDGKSTTTATISLTVTDENEVPVFNQTEYHMEQFESMRLTEFPSAGFSIYDPDVSDSFTYWLDCDNDTWRFIMHNTTGTTLYSYNYDLDRILIKEFKCVVRAKDTGFNTCTASLIVKIKDTNDNLPYFNQTQFALYTSPYENVGAFIGSVTAFDIDISEYGTFTYDMTSNVTYYVDIFNNGTLYVNQPLNSTFIYGDVMTFNLSAMDYNGSLQTTVLIWIVFAEENKTLPAAVIRNTPKNFRMSAKNTIWLTAFVILTISTILGTILYWSKYWHAVDCTSPTESTPRNDISKEETIIENEEDISNNNNNTKREISDVKSINKLKSIDEERLPGSPWFKRLKTFVQSKVGKDKTPLPPVKAPLQPLNKPSIFTIIRTPTLTDDQLTSRKIIDMYKMRRDISSLEILDA